MLHVACRPALRRHSKSATDWPSLRTAIYASIWILTFCRRRFQTKCKVACVLSRGQSYLKLQARMLCLPSISSYVNTFYDLILELMISQPFDQSCLAQQLVDPKKDTVSVAGQVTPDTQKCVDNDEMAGSLATSAGRVCQSWIRRPGTPEWSRGFVCWQFLADRTRC